VSALLSRDNINVENLCKYAKEAAVRMTCNKLNQLEFAINDNGKPDITIFEFTTLYQAANAARVYERNGKRLYTALVGDSLLQVNFFFFNALCLFNIFY
jgi:hypothetical protein